MDTFRYILTLADIKEQYPTSSWVRITTITMISKLGQSIPLDTFRANFKPVSLRVKGATGQGFEWTMKKTTFYNQVTIGYRDQYSQKSIKLFPNGSIQVAGCSDLFDCRRILHQVAFLLSRTLWDGTTETANVAAQRMIENLSVKMINTNFSLNSAVNLNKVITAFSSTANQARINYLDERIYRYHMLNENNEELLDRLVTERQSLGPKIPEGKFHVTFDPDRYSAVKVKFSPDEGMKKVTASIFSTGKIIVTGAQTLNEIAFAYQDINEVLLCKNTRLGDSPKKDVFGTIFGHNFEELVPVLQSKGFFSWTRV